MSKDGFFGSDHVETGGPQNANEKSIRRIFTTDRKQRPFFERYSFSSFAVFGVRFRGNTTDPCRSNTLKLKEATGLLFKVSKILI